MIISTSFLSEKNFSANGYALFPREFCFDAYKFVFRNPRTIFKFVCAYNFSQRL
ncbi:MAG: hypothetical protein L6V93_05725 [Clostridiales bacterium]|nr:MAG: hypothetical protein L6V93_05725 [Clostridiales bacterium]